MFVLLKAGLKIVGWAIITVVALLFWDKYSYESQHPGMSGEDAMNARITSNLILNRKEPNHTHRRH